MTELTSERARDLLRIIEALEDELERVRNKVVVTPPPRGLREMKLWLERAVFLGTKTGAP